MRSGAGNGRGAARIGDVAKAAGVSTATVSRALSNPSAVRPQTRERIFKAVHALNYTPNEAARALRAGLARMALVVVPRLYDRAFFGAVLDGIEAELSDAGYTMITGSLDTEEDKSRRLVDLVYARQIDGVIVLANCVGPPSSRSVLDAGVPVVAVCAELDRPGRPTVLIDDRVCAVAQTRHLLELGHRRLLYLGGPETHYNNLQRYAGFRSAIAEAGLAAADVQRLSGDYTLASGVAAAQEFLRRRRRPTGVVCCGDEMAIGFLKTIAEAGLRVPEEVSIVGFDDIEFAQFCSPSLTTIHQPRKTMGALGARLMLDALNGAATPADAPIVIHGELRVRGSTGPAPGGNAIARPHSGALV